MAGDGAKRMTVWLTAIGLVSAVLGHGAAYGQAGEQGAVPRNVPVVLRAVRLADAVERISRVSGVEIEIGSDVYAMCPDGRQTMIRELDFSGVTLREGLRRMFAPLGLAVGWSGNTVRIEPRDVLLRLGRAPTWEELALLTDLAAMEPGIDAKSRASLKARVQFQVGSTVSWEALDSEISKIGAGSGDEVLTLACKRLACAWVPDGGRVAVISRDACIARRLSRPIEVRVNYRPISDVLSEIGKKTGLEIRIAPDEVAMLPLSIRQSFSINTSLAPAEDILKQISAHIGLAFTAEHGAVVFRSVSGEPVPEQSWQALARAYADQPTSAVDRMKDPYVGKIVIPLDDGTRFEWLVRQSELPEDLRVRRVEDLRRAFERLRSLPPDSGE